MHSDPSSRRQATDEPEHFDGSDDGYVGMSAGMLDSMIDDQASEGSDDGEYDSDEEVEDSYEADDAEEAVEEGDGSDGGGAEDSRAEAEDGGAKDAASEERPTKRSKSSVAVLTNGHSQPMASGSSSNTFNLQLSALLDSTLLSPTPHPGLSALLKELHDILLSLPSIPPNRPIDARKVLHNKIPDISPTEYAYDVKGKGKEVQWKLGWEKPGEVLVGGSWGVCGGYKKGKGVEGDVDLVVVMPKVRRFMLSRRLLIAPRTCSPPKTGQTTGTSTNASSTSPSFGIVSAAWPRSRANCRVPKWNGESTMATSEDQ